jgi:hypothetical protein
MKTTFVSCSVYCWCVHAFYLVSRTYPQIDAVWIDLPFPPLSPNTHILVILSGLYPKTALRICRTEYKLLMWPLVLSRILSQAAGVKHLHWIDRVLWQHSHTVPGTTNRILFPFWNATQFPPVPYSPPPPHTHTHENFGVESKHMISYNARRIEIQQQCFWLVFWRLIGSWFLNDASLFLLGRMIEWLWAGEDLERSSRELV